MAFRSLVRRKAQLALLAAACERQEPARVRIRGVHPASAEPHDSHMLALQPDGLLLDWNGGPVPSGRVSVAFGHRGHQYSLDAESRGVVELPGATRRASAIKLGLPLRLIRRSTRRSVRYSLADRPVVIASFHGVLDARLCFEARIDNLSGGGMCVVTADGRAAAAPLATLCWVEFVLGGDDGPARFEFVVRLTRAEPLPDGAARLGWAFQPGDDGELHDRRLREIERLLAPGQRAVGKEHAGC